jgi:hypothetical protein
LQQCLRFGTPECRDVPSPEKRTQQEAPLVTTLKVPKQRPGKGPHGGRRAFALKLASHAAMGTAMGLSFCLLLVLMGRPDLASMIAHDATPKVTAIALIGFTSLMFAVGATLTGIVLMIVDEG